MKDIIFVPGLGESVANYKFGTNFNLVFPIHTIPRDYIIKEFNDQIQPILNSISSIKNQGLFILSGRSFGCYLLMQSLLELNIPFQGVLALFSPVFGYPLIHKDKAGCPQFIGSKLKHAKPLKKSLDQGFFPMPAETHIHYGEFDTQCDTNMCKKICRLANIEPVILYRTGHDLGSEYIEREIEKLACRINPKQIN